MKFNDGEGRDYFDEDTMPITTDNYLYLSGTPFRAITSGEFIQEQIFNWTYSDEQNAWRLCKPLTPTGQWELQIPVAKRCYGSLTFEVRIRMNSFSSQLDENAAANIGWQEKWLIMNKQVMNNNNLKRIHLFD